MPTLDEIEELCNKCSWQWTEVNGIKGQKVTGPNGKTKNVIAVYQIDKGSNTPRLVTNYVEGK